MYQSVGEVLLYCAILLIVLSPHDELVAVRIFFFGAGVKTTWLQSEITLISNTYNSFSVTEKYRYD